MLKEIRGIRVLSEDMSHVNKPRAINRYYSLRAREDSKKAMEKNWVGERE